MSSVHWDHFNNRRLGSGGESYMEGGGGPVVHGSWNLLRNYCSAFINSDELYNRFSKVVLPLLFKVLWKEGLTAVHPYNMEGARGPGPGEGSLALKGLRGTLRVNRDEAGGDRWLTGTVSIWHLLLCRMWPQEGRYNGACVWACALY